MTTKITKVEALTSGFVFAKNKNSNYIEKTFITSDVQIGVDNLGKNFLKITGDLFLSSTTINLLSGKTYQFPKKNTFLGVRTTSTSGMLTIKLPSSPDPGQILIIKDESGTASDVNIFVECESSQTIDGSLNKLITTDYGVLQLLWSGSGWYTIGTSSDSSSSGAPTNASYIVLGANSTLTNERVLTSGRGISITSDSTTVTISSSGSGTGDVEGPALSTDNGIVRFDGDSGKIIQNSDVTIDDLNNAIIPGGLRVDGATIDLGTTAVTRTVNIGTGGDSSSTVTSPQTIVIGSDNSTSSVLIKSGGGKVEVTTSLGDIEIAAAAHVGSSRNVKVGTGAYSSQEHVYIGSSSGASSLQLDAGTGTILIGTTSSSRTVEFATGLGDQIVKVGSPSGASELTLDSGTGDIKIGARDSARNIYIGSHPDSGTGGSANNKQQIYIGARGLYTGNEVNICDGGSGTGHQVRIISENSSQSSGSSLIKVGTIEDTCYVTIGNLFNDTYVKIRGGNGGVEIDSDNGDILIGTSNVNRTINIGVSETSQQVNIASNAARTGSHRVIVGAEDGLLGFFGGNTTSGTATGYPRFGRSAYMNETAGFTQNVGTEVRDDSTFSGNVGSKVYTISDIVKALKNYNLLDP